MARYLLILLCLIPGHLWALEFSSQSQKTTVVELYTSEGCSSCPPADKWLSSLKSDPRLFKTLIPMAFHVDYWDRLGWPDRFASQDYSERQRALVSEGILSQVYTPGIVVDSDEWRGWFNGQRKVDSALSKPGPLSASVEQGELRVVFDADETFTVHVAALGMGLVTEVEAGENRGRQLQHDFVVLATWQQTGQREWLIDLSDWPDRGQQQSALAIWLTQPGKHEVVQAAGHYLD